MLVEAFIEIDCVMCDFLHFINLNGICSRFFLVEICNYTVCITNKCVGTHL